MTVEYRTTDTDELAPYPDMTGDDLEAFEDWAAEIEQGWRGLYWWLAAAAISAVVTVAVVVS